MKQTATKEGLSPRALADRNSQLVSRAMAEALDISNDDFIRTTEERHYRSSEEIWRRMEKAGDIYPRASTRAGTPCATRPTSTRRRRKLGADGVRVEPLGSPVEWTEEETYFFRLSAYQDRLLAHYAKHPDFILPPERRNEVVSFVKAGLQDLSVSRTTLDWGIKVPRAPDARHVRVGRCAHQLHHGGGLPRREAPSAGAIGRPMCTSSARTSCASTRSTGRPS